MKTLLILRHAKSSWKNDQLADHDRPLAGRGKRDAPLMGDLVRREELLPDVLLSSSARRARTTAQIIAEASGYEGEICIHEELYFSGADAYLEILNTLEDDPQRVMVVGHNPDLEQLLEILTGEYHRLPTSALAEVRLPINHWSELDETTQGQLVNLWCPRDLVQ